MRSHFLLVSTAVLIVGADGPLAETKKLQGTWAVVAAEGIDAPQEAVKQVKVVIRGNTLHLMVPDRDKEKTTLHEKEKAKFTLDPSQKPKAIDLVKDSKELTARGIYELTEDTLKLAWRRNGPRPMAFPMQQRPQRFTGGPPEDADLVLMVLKRENQP